MKVKKNNSVRGIVNGSKANSGITLVALVVTVIVLLILAGVSISFLLGDNGILLQTQSAVSKTKIATVKEEVNLALASIETDYFAKWSSNTSEQRSTHYTEENLAKYLSGEVTLKSPVADTALSGTKTYIIEYSGAEYEITLTPNDNGSFSLKTDPVGVEED